MTGLVEKVTFYTPDHTILFSCFAAGNTQDLIELIQTAAD
jgi:hypothetical protein